MKIKKVLTSVVISFKQIGLELLIDEIMELPVIESVKNDICKVICRCSCWETLVHVN